MNELKSNNKQPIHINNILKYSNKLKEYARYLTQLPEDAEDLYQETIYRSLYFAHNYKDIGYMESWLKTIMRNTHLNNVSHTHHNTIIFNENYTLVEESQQHEDTFVIDDLNSAIQQLPKGEQQIIVMRIQGYSYKDISDTLHINIGTVKSTIHRIRKRLKTMLY